MTSDSVFGPFIFDLILLLLWLRWLNAPIEMNFIEAATGVIFSMTEAHVVCHVDEKFGGEVNGVFICFMNDGGLIPLLAADLGGRKPRPLLAARLGAARRSDARGRGRTGAFRLYEQAGWFADRCSKEIRSPSGCRTTRRKGRGRFHAKLRNSPKRGLARKRRGRAIGLRSWDAGCPERMLKRRGAALLALSR